MEMFEQAARLKLRFATKLGNLTTEDVFDLPLTSAKGVSLDSLARELNSVVKAGDEESFVTTASTASVEDKLKFEIVKHVIAVRLEENETKKNAKAKAEQKQVILNLIAGKKTEALAGKTVEELEALL